MTENNPRPPSPGDDFEKVVEGASKLAQEMFSSAKAFLNVVLIGGYAAFFTIWSFTKDLIPARASIWAALMLTVSAGLFLSFEVVQMVLITTLVRQFNRATSSGATPQEYVERLERLKISQRRLNRAFIPFWWVLVPATFLTAMAGLVILGTQFVMRLLNVV